MRELRDHLTYANAMSTIAVFLAIGGIGWAASTLPPKSVGTAQLKKNAVTSPKIQNSQVTGDDVKEATLAQVPTAGNAVKLGNALPAAYNIGRAYGYITEGGTVDPARSRNIAGASRPSDGVYCVTLAAGIALGSVAPIITLDAQFSATTIPPQGNSDDEGIIEWDSVPEDCPAGTLEFDSLKQGFVSGSLNQNLRDNQSFSVLIP
ncbi:MAG TPA: hypothetical protein VJT75_09720 [Thermoleophilaceae bacterium]|nr:hypothetical protein [Thermoleophilaceae bacterium]